MIRISEEDLLLAPSAHSDNIQFLVHDESDAARLQSPAARNEGVFVRVEGSGASWRVHMVSVSEDSWSNDPYSHMPQSPEGWRCIGRTMPEGAP